MQSHMFTGYRFLGGGPIALHGLVHFRNTTGPSLTKVVYANFDRISYKSSSYWKNSLMAMFNSYVNSSEGTLKKTEICQLRPAVAAVSAARPSLQFPGKSEHR